MSAVFIVSMHIVLLDLVSFGWHLYNQGLSEMVRPMATEKNPCSVCTGVRSGCEIFLDGPWCVQYLRGWELWDMYRCYQIINNQEITRLWPLIKPQDSSLQKWVLCMGWKFYVVKMGFFLMWSILFYSELKRISATINQFNELGPAVIKQKSLVHPDESSTNNNFKKIYTEIVILIKAVLLEITNYWW